MVPFFSPSEVIWPWTFTEYLTFLLKSDKIFWNKLFWCIWSDEIGWNDVSGYCKHHRIHLEYLIPKILTRLQEYFSKSIIYFGNIKLFFTCDESFQPICSANKSLRPNLQQLPVETPTFLPSFPNYSDLNNEKSWKILPLIIIRNLTIKNKPSKKTQYFANFDPLKVGISGSNFTSQKSIEAANIDVAHSANFLHFKNIHILNTMWYVTINLIHHLKKNIEMSAHQVSIIKYTK